MIVEAQVTINGSKAATWAAITSIENASEIINGFRVFVEPDRAPLNGKALDRRTSTNRS